MKIFEMRRLGPGGAIDLIKSYVGEKLMHRELVGDQKKLIAYFNILVNYDLYHREDKGNYTVMHSAEHGDVAMRKPFCSDPTVYRQIYSDEEYGLLASLIRKHVSSGDVTMIDGGANIGLTSIYLQEKLRDTHRLLSVLVEPDSENVAMIKRNLLLQGIDHFHIEQAGLYNRSCFLSIVNDFRDGLEWSIQVVESEKPTELRAVEVAGLAVKYGWARIDVLKMDIEGAERFLLNDEDYARGFLQKVHILAVELHDEYVDRGKILSMLERIGFQLSVSGELHIGVNSHLS